jgi:hypothetical protein
MCPKHFAAGLTALLIVAQSDLVYSGTRRDDIAESNYASFAADPMFSPVGGLISRSMLNAGLNPVLCSVTLINTDVVLTAGHCLFGPDKQPIAPNDLFVAFGPRVDNVASGTADVTSYQFHPNFQTDTTMWPATGVDLAVIKLSTTVNSISPMPLHTAGQELGSDLLLAGYGFRGDGIIGFLADTQGIKLAGRAQITQIAQTQINPSVDQLQFDFQSPDGLPGDFLELMIAPGDSGGAAVTINSGVAELSGVHEAGYPIGPLPSNDPDVLFYGNGKYGSSGSCIRVTTYAPWIKQAAGLP